MSDKVKIETEAQKKAAADKAAAEKAKADKAAADKAAAEKKAAADKAAAEKAKSYTVKTPAKGFTGVSMGVSFNDGVGKTDNPWLAQRFKESGYEVK